MAKTMSYISLTGVAIAMVCSPIYIYAEKTPEVKQETVKKEPKKKGCNCGSKGKKS
jgi:hypothetical protein